MMTEEEKNNLTPQDDQLVTPAEDKVNHKMPTRKRAPMLLWIIALVALIGFALLFIQFLANPLPVKEKENTNLNLPATNEGVRIAFVYVDSLQQNYAMAQYYRDSIQKRIDGMQATITKKENAYRQKASSFIKNVNDGTLSEQMAQNIRTDLAKEEEAIYKLQEDYSERFSKLEYDLNMIYLDSIWDFLNRNKEEMGYDIVMGFQKGATNLYFVDDALDITNKVLEALNKAYYEKYPHRKKEKKTKKKK